MENAGPQVTSIIGKPGTARTRMPMVRNQSRGQVFPHRLTVDRWYYGRLSASASTFIYYLGKYVQASYHWRHRSTVQRFCEWLAWTVVTTDCASFIYSIGRLRADDLKWTTTIFSGHCHRFDRTHDTELPQNPAISCQHVRGCRPALGKHMGSLSCI